MKFSIKSIVAICMMVLLMPLAALAQQENSSESVSEVAYQVGFNDPLYFSRKFKEAFGISPSKVNGRV